MRDLGIADRLRNEGLKVVEVAGWQTRGSEDFDPRGSVDHHTAGAALGNAPSLRICTEGRSDLPGPLCHVLVARDNTCYVIASGKANHAGLGGWNGLTGNGSVYGVERENVGTPAEPWRPDQTATAARVHAALIRGRTTVDKVCLHREWAPTRKIDAHTITGDELRAAVGRVLAGTEDELDTKQAMQLQQTFERVSALTDNDNKGLRQVVRQEVRALVNPKTLAERIAKKLPDADAKVIAAAVTEAFAEKLGED